MTVAKPKIVFVTEKWANCDPRLGPSVEHSNFLASLESTGLADQSALFIDEHVVRTGRHVDDDLCSFCAAEAPDIIFLKMVRGSDLNPSTAALARAKAEAGAKVVAVFGDTTDKAAIEWIDSYAGAIDLNVLQDCYSTFRKYARDPSKYHASWTPQDPQIFHTSARERDIDVVFLGSVRRYPDRKRALSSLHQAGIDVVHHGGQDEDGLSIEAYAELLRRAKISLNFARTVFDESEFQCKGRVFETTLSGAFLLEQANPETRVWFTPGEHYVEYGDERDLREKVLHYLGDEAERARIAAAGCARANERYSARAYWHEILSRLLPQFGTQAAS